MRVRRQRRPHVTRHTSHVISVLLRRLRRDGLAAASASAPKSLSRDHAQRAAPPHAAACISSCFTRVWGSRYLHTAASAAANAVHQERRSAEADDAAAGPQVKCEPLSCCVCAVCALHARALSSRRGSASPPARALAASSVQPQKQARITAPTPLPLLQPQRVLLTRCAGCS